MLTRKHFQVLADAVAGISHDCSKVKGLTPLQAQIIYAHISKVCIRSNPRFDTARFDAHIRKTALDLHKEDLRTGLNMSKLLPTMP